MKRELKLSGFDEQANGSNSPISRQQQHRSLAEHTYRNTFDRPTVLLCRGPDFWLKKVIFPFKDF
jgi:hypothetical protein